MKLVYNNILPFKGFLAMNLFSAVLIRIDSWMKCSPEVKAKTINHEGTHDVQMKELLYVFFYIIYGLEWIYRVITNPKHAYRSISFEREAYDNEDNPDYLKTRKHFAQWRKNYGIS